MNFDHGWLLWLLPLAALPMLAASAPALSNGWLAFAPRDGASRVIGWALRVAAALALAALIVALAGPYRPETTVERIGQGAEIVLVLDRSRSMDQGFASNRSLPAAARGTGPEALDYYMTQVRTRESKGQAARRLLAEFARQRPDDRFALVAFSTLPIRVLDFTQRAEVVQAAIAAGNIGRGQAEQRDADGEREQRRLPWPAGGGEYRIPRHQQHRDRQADGGVPMHARSGAAPGRADRR